MNMQQNNDDQKFENFLRQFRPAKPQALSATGKSVVFSARFALRVAAGLLLIVGGFFGIYRIGKVPMQSTMEQSQTRPAAKTNTAQAISLGRLTRLMEEDPAKADAELDKASRWLLPDVRRSHGALGALAAE